MKVRIVKRLTGVMDGVPLGSLVCGFVYDLHHHIANQLIEMGDAVAVRAADPETIKSVEDLDIAWLSGGVHVFQPDAAHDRPPRKRRKAR